MKKIPLLLLFIIPFLAINSQCHYVFDMQDSYGDGWNGASVEVSINGTFAADITCNGGASVDSISTMNGDVVDLSFVSGNWDTEITFQIYDPSGSLILSVGPFANNDGNDAFLLSDSSNSSCVPQFVNVTFQVDMNKVTSTFTIPELNGSWNAYCGNCDPMSDPDGDNVWEKTVSLFTGSYEYIFSADSLAIQESINSNFSCSNGSFVLPRRFLNVGSQNITLPIVCWESCEACNDFPQPPSGLSCSTGGPSLAFSDECNSQGNWTGDFGTGNGIWQSNTGNTPTGGTGPDGAHSGSNYFYYESSTFGNNGPSQFDTASIVSPMIDLTNSLDDAELTFWLHARGDNMGSLQVGLSNSPTGPFNAVYYQYGETHANDDDPWTQIGIDVSNYIGQNLYVSFTYMRNYAGVSYSGDLCIDLIEVNSCSTCPSPTSLSVSNITSNSANISWVPSGSETEWMLHYNGISTYTNSIPTFISGLSANTSYNINVSAICSSSDTSGLSSFLNFTTGCAYSLAPLTENFDTGFSPCWSQEQINDDFDWTLNDGGTNSAGTGPDDDVSGGGNYMYTEASAPRQDGDLAIMYSEQIDLSNLTNPQIHFYTHMYGSAIGELQIDMYDGGNYVNIFNKTGDQGDIWVEETVLINPSTNFVHFKITGVLGVNANGDTWPGDISFDEFSVMEAIATDLGLLAGGTNSACELSSTEQISIEIINNGVNSESNFDVSYKINSGNTIVENFVFTINPGDTLIYDFNTLADLSSDGVYNIEYECLLSTDQNLSDNLLVNSVENFYSPLPPITINDTICNGDTAHLLTLSSNGLVNWYNDINGVSALNGNKVSPSQTTTYYGEVQAAEFYIDDFESYPTGSLIALSSSSWLTYSGIGGGQDDAMITNSPQNSGNNSLFINELLEDDIYLPFSQVYNSGSIEVAMDIYVGTQAHFNFEDGILPGSNSIFELRFKNSGILEFDIGPTTLLGSYPGPGNWFKLKIIGDLNTSTWYVYVNGTFQGGSSFIGGDVVGNIHFAPQIGDEYYLENVEWYAFSDDDCVSSLSPVTVVVDDCLGIKDENETKLEIYPNPSDGLVLVKVNSLIKNILIYDVKGKLSYSNFDINNSNYKLDLSILESGIYFTKVVTNIGVLNKKITIK